MNYKAILEFVVYIPVFAFICFGLPPIVSAIWAPNKDFKNVGELYTYFYRYVIRAIGLSYTLLFFILVVKLEILLLKVALAVLKNVLKAFMAVNNAIDSLSRTISKEDKKVIEIEDRRKKVKAALPA